MRQLFNTLLYGDSKTRRILWTLVVLTILALLVTIVALLTKQTNLFALAVILGVVVLIISQQYTFSDLSMEAEPEDTKPVAPEDVLTRYTEKRLQQIFVKYRVRPNHRLVMVDSSEKYKIKQTPAYIWTSQKKFHMLLMEKNARELVLPLASACRLGYKRGVPVDIRKDYIQFRKPSLLAAMFEDYLPTTYERGQGPVRQQYKNLYLLGDEIALTNRSVNEIFELTGANFKIQDSITESGDYSEDFIEMYQDYTLFRDHIISGNQYRDRVTKLLDDMAVSNMLDPELEINLQKMKNFHFLTEEYANYCLEKRRKHRKK